MDCPRCREARRIAKELYAVGQDLGTLYGIATGTGEVAVTTRTAAGEPLFRSKTARKTQKKAKRKVTQYQRRFGLELKRLKKKHPRTDISRLMKRAHTATKRAM